MIEEDEVSDDLLREFLVTALLSGGKFSAFANTPKDLVDEWLYHNHHPDVFSPAQERDFLNFENVDGELDYYEVTEAGKDFVRGAG